MSEIKVLKTPAIYNDDSLPMIVQSVDFIEVWPTKPQVTDFPKFAASNKRNFGTVSHVYQFHEAEKRAELTSYLINDKKIAVGTRINELPKGYLTFTLANLLYNNKINFDGLIPGRLNHTLSLALYCLPMYWVGYFLIELLIKNEDTEKKNDYRYRMLVLDRIQECLGAGIRNLLTEHPNIMRSNDVIVNATTSIAEKAVLYCDATNLYKWTQSGNTLDDLCVNWINNRYIPKV